MLEHIKLLADRFTVYRLASFQSDPEFMRNVGIDDADGIREIEALLKSARIRGGHTLLDKPFRAKHQPGRPHQRKFDQTRFSDGTFPVFYASLDTQTAEAEVKHWFVYQLPKLPSRHRTLYYYRFKCDFEGTVKDLRPMIDDWPALTHLTDYAFCNVLGSEAVGESLDAFLAPSARRIGGTNVPVFARRALSNAQEVEMVSLTFNYKSSTVDIATVDSD